MPRSRGPTHGGQAGMPWYPANADEVLEELSGFIADVAIAGRSILIKHSPSELVIQTSRLQRRHTHVEKLDVRIAGEVAQQRSGWREQGYLIEIRTQHGIVITETLTWDCSGDQLRIVTSIESRSLQRPIEFLQVYDRNYTREQLETAPTNPSTFGAPVKPNSSRNGQQ